MNRPINRIEPEIDRQSINQSCRVADQTIRLIGSPIRLAQIAPRMLLEQRRSEQSTNESPPTPTRNCRSDARQAAQTDESQRATQAVSRRTVGKRLDFPTTTTQTRAPPTPGYATSISSPSDTTPRSTSCRRHRRRRHCRRRRRRRRRRRDHLQIGDDGVRNLSPTHRHACRPTDQPPDLRQETAEIHAVR